MTATLQTIVAGNEAIVAIKQANPTVSRTEIMALAVLHDSDDQTTMTELAERLGMSRGALTALVDRLARKGLALRVLDTVDRRCIMVELTAEGERLVVS